MIFNYQLFCRIVLVIHWQYKYLCKRPIHADFKKCLTLFLAYKLNEILHKKENCFQNVNKVTERDTLAKRIS